MKCNGGRLFGLTSWVTAHTRRDLERSHKLIG